ncbi:MAG TPA: TonB family protein [Bryobacteraceae bacterium]|nr:TonB family protein [Bryobacteraceae bacterium]
MFDAISVSERTRKPWTVVASFIGQIAVIGLAILVPLVSTERLPHGHSLGDLFMPPEPPRALPHRPPQAANAKQTNMVPPQLTIKGLVLPTRIPDKPTIIQDPELDPAASVGVGVPGGFGDSNGSGNGVIDSLLAKGPAKPPPPTQEVKQTGPPTPPPRIRLGGKVEESKLISGPRPVYPPLARQARVSGTVRLEAVISRDGTILNLRAVSGHPLLIPAAVAAVQKWVFRPTYLNGEAVEVATQIDVNFMLN